MNNKILAGLVMSLILLGALGSTTKSFAISTQDTMLVADPIKHSGDKPTFHWVPKPVELPDGVPAPKPASNEQMMLVADPIKNSGDKPTFHWVPKPVELPDGVPAPKPVSSNVQDITPRQSVNNMPDNILVADPIKNSGDKVVFHWVPKPVELPDGTPAPKPASNEQMMLVADPIKNSGDKPTFHWIPKPVEHNSVS